MTEGEVVKADHKTDEDGECSVSIRKVLLSKKGQENSVNQAIM